MNKISVRSKASPTGDLRRVVEPLASYICAADQPKAALFSALAVLFHEVNATNRAARTHFRNYSEN
jgi:hypothetical protein